MNKAGSCVDRDELFPHIIGKESQAIMKEKYYFMICTYDNQLNVK